MDEPNTHEQSHSTYAQNLTREILEEALPYLNIYPDEIAPEGALTPDETNYFTGLDGVAVPSASGRKTDAQDAEEADGTSDTQTQDAAESQTDDGQTAENQ